jgi:sulfopyruvate decarboxylase subunit beta
MNLVECCRYLAARRTNEIVVTSAGTSAQAWWTASGHDSEWTFYLDASMSLSTMFAAGMAMNLPRLRFWAFMGDGAFCMNPGALMVERDLDLPNLVHLLVSNRTYGVISNATLPNRGNNDYRKIAQGMGVERVYHFDAIDKFRESFDEVMLGNAPGCTFVVLEVDELTDEEQRMELQPTDGPELKYRFGRMIEKIADIDIFGYKV